MSSASNNTNNNSSDIPNFLDAVDEVEIQFLVDNNLDDLSTIPSPLQDNAEVQNGTAWQVKTGAMKTTFAGECLCCAQHGFSVLISVRKFGSSSLSGETEEGEGELKQQIIFDAGPWGPTFVDNCRKLDRDLTKVNSIALSHGHFDHAGGILDALREIHRQKQQEDDDNNEEEKAGGSEIDGNKKIMSLKTPTYMNSDQVVKRAIQVPFSPEPMPLGPVPTPDEINDAGGTFIDTGKEEYFIPYERGMSAENGDGNHHERIDENNRHSFFYISGEIPRVTSYEKGLNYHYTFDTNTNKWEFDTMVMDERFLAVYLKNRGLIVFSSCSHAGIVNVVKHATEKFKNITKSTELANNADDAVPVYAVVGGLHLSGRDKDPIIDDTVADLCHVPFIVPGHCTGFRAVHALLNKYGDKRVIPAATGKLITWRST